MSQSHSEHMLKRDYADKVRISPSSRHRATYSIEDDVPKHWESERGHRHGPYLGESKGIDGYIGKEPVSIKPITYKTKNMLNEQINVKIIFYDKKKDGINIDISELE